VIWEDEEGNARASFEFAKKGKKRQPADSPPPGTTYSCVATYEGTNVEIIANEQGSFTTPSFVSFTDKERLIGEAAKNNAAMNPKNTVFDAK
jgi:Hsp70 protein